jgi:hypothetical protein
MSNMLNQKVAERGFRNSLGLYSLFRVLNASVVSVPEECVRLEVCGQADLATRIP